MPNITQITPPRVPIIDERTGYMTREWYRYFYNLYYATGGENGGAVPVDRGGTGLTTLVKDGILYANSTESFAIGKDLTFDGTDFGTTGAVNAGTNVNADNNVNAGNDVNATDNVIAGVDVNAGNDVIAVNDVTAGANVNVTGHIATPTYIDFNDNVANPAYHQGRLFYDDTAKALSYYNDANGVTINLGQEEVIRVFNNTGADILNGQLCYISGASDEFPEVTLAKADTAATSASTIGMATADIADQTYGYITTSGLVHDVNTATFTAGQTLYLSDSVAGGYTNVAPLQPSYAIIIGYVTAIDATTGAIYVHIDRLPWYPNGEIRLTAASTALPTTPTVFTAPSVITQQGISYDNATGVLTINTSGSFTLSHTFNCSPSAANKKVYFYVEESTDGGTTWIKSRYSARQLELINGTETQLIIVGSRYYATGTKVRYYLWGDATVTLKTTNLPGTTPGTVTLPAYRLTLAG